MPFVAIENTLKVTLRLMLVGHECALRWYAKYPSSPTPTTLADLATAVGTWWDEELSPLLPAQVGFLAVDVLDMSQVDGDTLHIDLANEAAGTYAGNALPNSVALVITWNTGFSGRSKRGRTYIPGIPYEALETDNTVSDQYRLDMWQAAEALATAIEGTNADFVIVSFVSNGEPRETPLCTPVVDQTVNAKIDSQRRRLKAAT